MQVERRQVLPEGVGAGKCRNEKLTDYNESKQVGVKLPDAPLGQIDEQNLFSVHNIAKVERRVLLCNDGAHDFVGGERIEFVGDIGPVVLQPLLAGRLLSNAF